MNHHVLYFRKMKFDMVMYAFCNLVRFREGAVWITGNLYVYIDFVSELAGTELNTTADKLFLLSEIEVFGSVSYSKSGEGTQYDYYKAGNSTVKKRNGSANSWWERSPYDKDSMDFCAVYGSGKTSYSSASTARGVAFGFCF